MKLIYSGLSETGFVREKNEDALLMRATENAGLFLIADGIGGIASGEIVSGMLRDGYASWWDDRFVPQQDTFSIHDTIQELKMKADKINHAVIDQYGEYHAGSTLALLFLYRGVSISISSGDSRIYRARKFSFQQYTRDDTVSKLTNQTVFLNNSTNEKLISAVGIRQKLACSIKTDKLRKNDRFLLCSDGVYRFISAKSLKWSTVFGGMRNHFEKTMRAFTEEIERNGAEDNYTVILVRYQ